MLYVFSNYTASSLSVIPKYCIKWTSVNVIKSSYNKQVYSSRSWSLERPLIFWIKALQHIFHFAGLVNKVLEVVSYGIDAHDIFQDTFILVYLTGNNLFILGFVITVECTISLSFSFIFAVNNVICHSICNINEVLKFNSFIQVA